MHRIWILKNRDDLDMDDNPWAPWYDKCFGMVIAAASEEEARKIASQNACDEARYINPWLTDKYSRCDELEPSNFEEGRLILQDVHYG